MVILVRHYDAALAFYRAAFGARVLFDGAAVADGSCFAHVADRFGNEVVLVELMPTLC